MQFYQIKSNSVSTQSDESLTLKENAFPRRQQPFLSYASKILKLVVVSRHIRLASFHTIQKDIYYIRMFFENISDIALR